MRSRILLSKLLSCIFARPIVDGSATPVTAFAYGKSVSDAVSPETYGFIVFLEVDSKVDFLLLKQIMMGMEVNTIKRRIHGSESISWT
ncbi:hypothetical protein P8452_48884 [Trifolium repens]|nr:hypothetical protein P8452_48884 [Trifolium repens]